MASGLALLAGINFQLKSKKIQTVEQNKEDGYKNRIPQRGRNIKENTNLNDAGNENFNNST